MKNTANFYIALIMSFPMGIGAFFFLNNMGILDSLYGTQSIITMLLLTVVLYFTTCGLPFTIMLIKHIKEKRLSWKN